MELINRSIENEMLRSLRPNKVCLLLGARRVGKTVLVNNIVNKVSGKVLFLNGDDISTHKLIENRTIQNYTQLLSGTKLLVIDEAQMIPEIGLKLKLICDHIEGIQIIATGSSAFDLQNRFGEPLTGRSITFQLFPIAQTELNQYENRLQILENLNARLIYGSYPEQLNLPTNKEKELYLRELINNYLFKDILAIEGIQNTSKIHDLLRLIAYQTGKEVSFQEIGSQLSMSKNTVEKYLNLLSKTYVIYKLQGFSRNLRKEVTKNSRWYFYDNGIRNAVISNFNSLNERQDTGELWENYLLSERMKFNVYNKHYVNSFFWRTYDQQEIDLIEENNNKLNAYEIKWNVKKLPKAPLAWIKAYPDSDFKVINPDNYLEWIS